MYVLKYIDIYFLPRSKFLNRFFIMQLFFQLRGFQYVCKQVR